MVISSRTEAQLTEVADSIKAADRQAVVVPADLADPAAAANLAQVAVDTLGRLDV